MDKAFGRIEEATYMAIVLGLLYATAFLLFSAEQSRPKCLDNNGQPVAIEKCTGEQQ